MSILTPVDLLAFGPHPDDIEIGMAATIAKHVGLGYSVGLCDLTRGELGSNGAPEQRVAEGEAARRVLGAAWRVNLELPDGGLADTDPHVGTIVEIVRKARPLAIAIPFGQDRHPDHVAAHRLLTTAVFRSGLRRYTSTLTPWRPEWVCAYFINDSVVPSFVVDVSDVYEAKRRALACHRSQFEPDAPDGVATRLTSPLFLQLVESRDQQFGASAGVRFAEGFVVADLQVRALLVDRWPAATQRTDGAGEPDK